LHVNASDAIARSWPFSLKGIAVRGDVALGHARLHWLPLTETRRGPQITIGKAVCLDFQTQKEKEDIGKRIQKNIQRIFL
jgi:hypothetical protein